MAKRKEINIFGTSFLDLLSGALAAVIILFVVVPKGAVEDPELMEQVKELKTVAVDVKEALKKIENSIPKEVFEKIREDMEKAQKKVEELTQRLEKLEESVKKLTSENATLKKKIQEQSEEIEKLKEQLAKVQADLQKEKEKNTVANTVEKTLGVFAKFGIICKWQETDTDVDIGVQCFGTNQGVQEHCWRMFPSKKWGILGEDVRERVDEDEQERFELFYVPQIYADEYTLWVNCYEHSSGTMAHVSCIFVFHPGKADEVRREVGPVTVTKSSRNVLVATFRLSDTGFEFLTIREPIWGSGKVVK